MYATIAAVHTHTHTHIHTFPLFPFERFSPVITYISTYSINNIALCLRRVTETFDVTIPYVRIMHLTSDAPSHRSLGTGRDDIIICSLLKISNGTLLWGPSPPSEMLIPEIPTPRGSTSFSRFFLGFAIVMSRRCIPCRLYLYRSDRRAISSGSPIDCGRI